MANGAFNTSDAGNFGASPDRMYFEWTLLSQNEDGNYSTINWNIRGAGGSNGYWTQNHNARTTVNGSLRQSTGSFQMYQGSVFGNENMNIGHDSNGNKSFSASAVGRIYYNSDNTSGSGSWGLPSLYQAIGFNSITFTNITDVGFTVNVSVNRTANLLQLNIDGAGFVTYHSGTYTSKSVTVGGSGAPIGSGQQHSVIVRTRRNSNGWVTDSGTYYPTTESQNNFFDLGDF